MNYLVWYYILNHYLVFNKEPCDYIDALLLLLNIFKVVAALGFLKLIFLVFFKAKEDFKQLSPAEKNSVYSYLLKKEISFKKIGYKNIFIYTFISILFFFFVAYWVFILYGTSSADLLESSFIFIFLKRNSKHIAIFLTLIYSLFK
jgi:hypothetical protein